MPSASAEIRLDEAVLDQLCGHAAQWSGFREDAISRSAIQKAALSLGLGGAALLERARAGDERLAEALMGAISVGETYFFRQPEHFIFLENRLSLPSPARGGGELRGWSAGCATGEETFSLAALLLAVAGRRPGTTVEVLGTDLIRANLEVARKGRHGAWSVRGSGPLLHPVLEPAGGGQSQVLERVRRVTRFAQHNLLTPPPGGPAAFDVILCRNVLVYLRPDVIEVVCAHLAQALAPGGLLLFGAIDTDAVPAGLQRVKGPGLNAFERALAPQIVPRLVPPPCLPRPCPAPAPPPDVTLRAEPVGIHLRALSLIESGDLQGAETLLGELSCGAPDYLPGLLERALFLVRAGRARAAVPLMKELLRRVAQLPAERLISGPEHLPAAYYQASAEAFLARRQEE